MMKYHILFIKGTKIKATRIKNNCIAKIKSINKIQCIKIHRNYVALLYILLYLSSSHNLLNCPTSYQTHSLAQQAIKHAHYAR